MAFNPQIAGAVGGALLGAYTGNLTSDPITGITSAAALGGIGYFMKYSIPDLQSASLVNKSLSIDQLEVNRLSQIGQLTSVASRSRLNLDARLNSIDKSINRDQRIIDSLNRRLSNIPDTNIKGYSAMSSRIAALETSINDRLTSMSHELGRLGLPTNADMTSIRAALANVSDPVVLKRAHAVLGQGRSFNPEMAVNARTITSKSSRFSGTSKERELTKHFIEELGNSPELAAKKAGLITKRSGNSTVILKDHTASFEDIADGRRVSIPLTAYTKDGVRYHNAGDGSYYAVQKYNPLANYYRAGDSTMINGAFKKVTAGEMLKGQDMEEMLEHLPDHVPVSTITDRMGSLMRYGDNESLATVVADPMNFIPSAEHRAISERISIKHTLDRDGAGNITDNVFKNIGTSANEMGAKSDLSDFFDKFKTDLNPETAMGLHAGGSMNESTSYNPHGFQSFSPLADASRGDSSVGNRNYISVGSKDTNGVMNSIKQTMGNAGNKQFASGQAFRKLDIYEAEKFNEVVSSMFGGDYGLGDGSGIFNKENSEAFRVSRGVKEKITTNGKGGLIINNSHIQEWMKDPTYTHNGSSIIDIMPGEVLGVNAAGDEIKLNNQFTSAKLDLNKITKDAKGNLILNMEGQFNPASENSVKLFSTSSKALLHGTSKTSEFNTMAFIGQGLNTGSIEYENGLLHFKDKEMQTILGANSMTPLQFRDQLKKGNVINHIRSSVGGSYDIILDSANTGTKPVDKLMKKLENVKYIDQLNPDDYTDLYKADQINKSKQLARSLTGSLNEEEKVYNAMMATLITSNSKFSTDLMAKVHQSTFGPIDQLIAAHAIGDQTAITKHTTSVQDILNRLAKTTNGGALSGIDVTKALQSSSNVSAMRNQLSANFRRVTSTTNLTGKSSDSTFRGLSQFAGMLSSQEVRSGSFFAVGSVNVGRSVVGSGNKAKMSWNAQRNLKQYGYTDSDLSLFGSHRQSALYEVKAATEERRYSSKAITDKLEGKEHLFQQILGNKSISPEQRTRELENIGITLEKDSPFITHNLYNPMYGVESLNFSRISTERSGFYDDGQRKLAKDLDVLKRNIYAADIDLRYAKNAEEKAKKLAVLDSMMKEYGTKTKQMFRGDNNLLKEALSLESQHSMIATTRYNFNKEAVDFVEKTGTVSKYGFVSFSGAKELTDRLGIPLHNLKLASVADDPNEFSTLKKIMYKGKDGSWIPLTAMDTREPAQGPLSSNLSEVIVDSTLTTEQTSDHWFHTANQINHTLGQFGDGDQDTKQIVLGKFSTAEQQKELMAKHEEIRKVVSGMTDLQSAMKVKGKTKEMDTLQGMSQVDAAFYKVSQAQKGRERKLFAAQATDLATSLNKSMMKEFTEVGDKSTLIEGGVAIHQVVENLLKSAHLDTKEFGMQVQSPINRMMLDREAYIKGNNMSAEQYREKLGSTLGQFLNREGMTPDQQKRLDGIISNITEADVNHAKSTFKESVVPTDIAKHYENSDFLKAVEDVSLNSGLLDTEKGVGVKSAKQLYSGLNDAIVKTFKNNKKLLGWGVGGLVGATMLTRQSPNFDNSAPVVDRAAVMQHSGKMLRPLNTSSRTGQSYNDVQNGIETNRQGTAHIMPKSYTNGQDVMVEGGFIKRSGSAIGDTLLADPGQTMSNMNNAIFGNAIRMARIEDTTKDSY